MTRKKKAWYCHGCRALVTEFNIHFWTAQKFCRRCGSLLILETTQEAENKRERLKKS